MTVCPLAYADGHGAPGLIDQAVPSVAAMIDDGVAGREYPVRQPVELEGPFV